MIADNIKPQVDAATGGGKKMSLQDDYDMGKDTGVFVYGQNKDRYLKEKNVNAVMPKAAPAKEKVEVAGEQKQEVPIPKKSQRVESVDDTEGVTKPIIRPSGETTETTAFVKPLYKPKGIVKDPTDNVLANTDQIFSNKLETTAKEDIVEQGVGITMSDLVDSLTVGTVKDNNIPELPTAQFEKTKTALEILAHPNMGKTAKKNAEAQLAFALELINTKKATSDQDVKIAFDRGGKFSATDETVEDITLLSDQKIYQRSRRNVAKLIDGTFNAVFPENKQLAYKVEQSIIDNISTGKFWDTTIEGNILELQRAIILSGKDFLAETIQFGTVAIYDKILNGKDISESNAETKNERMEISRKWKKNAEKYLDTTSLATDINKMIHADFKNQLKTNKINEDEYNKLAYTTTVDPDGKETKLFRSFISEGQAQNLLFESIDQLTGTEQFLMIALDNFTGIYGFAKNRAKSAAKYKNVTLPAKIKSLNIEQIKMGNFRYMGMSDLEAAKAMKADGIKLKLNDGLIKDALQVEKIDYQFQKMVKRKQVVSQQLDDLKRAGVPENNLEYIKIENEYKSLHGKIFRNAVMARTKPILRESLGVALPASLAQYAFTEMFASKPGEEGLTFYDAQAMGAVTHIIATAMGKFSPYKLVINPTKYFVSQGGNMVAAFADFIEGAASLVGMPGAIGILRNSDMQTYNDMVIRTRGYGLSAGERSGMKYIFMMAREMSEENLKKVLDATKRNLSLDEAVAAGWAKDSEEYKIIREITRQPFASSSGLSWLKSAEALNHGVLDVRDLKDGKTLDNLIAIQEAKEQQLTLTTRALENFKQRIKGKVNIDNTEAVNQFIDKYETLIANETGDMIKKRSNLKDRISDLKEVIFSNPDVPVTTALSKAFADAGTELRMKLDKTLSRGEALEKEAQENFKLLNERAKIIESNKGSYKHADRAALLMEEVLENWVETYHAKGKVGYKEVDALALKENKTIDVSSLLVKLKEFDDTKSPLSNFFSRNGQFFNSSLNKRLRTSLNKMAQRSLETMKKTTLENLMKIAQTDSKGNKHFINKDADYLDVALYWSKEGKLKAFNALPSEVEDVYAAFRDYGYRRYSSNPQLATDYINQADEIRDLILAQSKGHYDKFVKAARTYKDQVFDRQDGTGPLSDFLKSKTSRVTEASKKGEQVFYKNNYKNVKPRDLFKTFTNHIEKYIRTGSIDDIGATKDYFSDVVRQMSDNVNGSPTFNLDIKENKIRFETMQKAIVENSYSNWGQKVVDSANKLSNVKVKKQLLSSMGGYDFKTLDVDRLKDLSQATMVTVIEGGKTKRVPLLNFTKLLEDQKDIVKVMENSQELRDKYRVFKDTNNDKIQNIASEVMDNINLRDEAIEKIRKLTALDEDSFLTAIIKGKYTKKNIDLLRQQAGTKGVSPKDFDEAVAYLLTNGVINSGGLKSIPNAFLTHFDGLPKPLKGFETPEAMLANLRNDNIKPLLQDLLGDNHVAFLDDIGNYLQRQKADNMDIERLTGLTRPMGTNEMISRAFNIARGMVSPTYVGAELAFRLASGAGIDMIKMAAKDPYAAELMAKMMEFPNTITKLELNTFRRLSIDFIITEFARMDLVIPDYFYDPQASDIIN